MNRKYYSFLFIFLLAGSLLILGGCQTKGNDGNVDDNTDENELSYSTYNLEGFGLNAVSSFDINETDGSYAKVETIDDLYDAITNKTIKVIEIMNDLDLGYKNLSSTQKSDSNFISNTVQPSLHPTLLDSGVSRIRIQDRNESKGNSGLLIFSASGATIKHAGFVIKRVDNLMIRNLKFIELWEWDEATKGEYDRNDWDFITLEDCNGVWIDHCTFGRSYDGLIDLKNGNTNVTFSWCSFVSEEQFVRAQMEYLEQHKNENPMFKYYRDQGMTLEDMIKVATPQKKGHLIGSSELDPDNNVQNLTIHNNYYYNLQDRLTRLRAGNAHIYNVFMDCNSNNEVKTIVENYNISSSAYKFGITSNAAISTEDGALFLENSIIEGVREPVKNNQKSGYPPEYTGKIAVRSCEYKLGSYTFLGGSSDTDSPFISPQAPMLEFSWNGFSALPYRYKLTNLNDLKCILENGCGSGVLTWDKSNWLKITY